VSLWRPTTLESAVSEHLLLRVRRYRGMSRPWWATVVLVDGDLTAAIDADPWNLTFTARKLAQNAAEKRARRVPDPRPWLVLFRFFAAAKGHVRRRRAA
jgi:hypothetical protein